MPISNNNFVNLIGHLGRDPDAKTLPSGQLMVTFSIATNDSYTDRNGNKIESVDWHRIKAFGRVAETLNQYLKKGSKVAILGSLRQRTWVDKYEQTRTTIDVVVGSFQFLENRNQRDAQDYSEGQQAAGNNAAPDPYEPPLDARRPPATKKADPSEEKDVPAAKKKLPF